MKGGSSDVPVQWFDHLLREDARDGLYKLAGTIHSTLERRLSGLWPLVYEAYGGSLPVSYAHHWLSGDILSYFRPPHAPSGHYEDAVLIIGTGWSWYPIDHEGNIVPSLGYRLWLSTTSRIVLLNVSEPLCFSGDRAQNNYDTFGEAFDHIEKRIRGSVDHRLVTR